MNGNDGMILPLLYELKELWEKNRKPLDLDIEALAPIARELLAHGLTAEGVQDVLVIAMVKIARVEDSATARRSKLELLPT